MKWWLSKPDEPGDVVNGTGSMEEAIKQSLVLSSMQDLLAWGRKNTMWPFHFGLSCCFV
jgi:NADH-quinone oxidoreductase subunit B